MVGVELLDERDRLPAGSEGPLAGLVRFGLRDGARVGAGCLRVEFRGMALAAGGGAGVIGGIDGGEEQREDQGDQKTNLAES